MKNSASKGEIGNKKDNKQSELIFEMILGILISNRPQQKIQIKRVDMFPN